MSHTIPHEYSTQSWLFANAGAARGHLVEVGQIDPEILSNLEKSTVLLVKAASGDEEIGGFKENLKGIILAQSLPHLSHLGKVLRGWNLSGDDRDEL